MANSSKRLGNQYERNFSYSLSEWITGEKNADVCWRDLSSGARATTRKKSDKGTQIKGDIVCTDPKYKEFFDLFFIDTKTFKELNIWINNPKNQKSNHLLKEWLKVCSDCPSDMIPIMPCYVRDRKSPEFIVTPLSFMHNFEASVIKFEKVTYKDQDVNLKILLWDEFKKAQNWKDLIKFNQLNKAFAFKLF